MCGYAGTTELAFYGLSNGPHVALILIGIGSVLPIAILTANADGAANCSNCGVIWRVGLIHAIVLGILLGILMLFGEEFFLLTGQSAELSAGGGRVLAMHGLGLAGLLCMVATSLFMEGLQRPLPAMVVSLSSNILNAYLNWVFIFGNHGSPALGAEGAALATSIVRWLSVAVLIAYILAYTRPCKVWPHQKNHSTARNFKTPSPIGISNRHCSRYGVHIVLDIDPVRRLYGRYRDRCLDNWIESHNHCIHGCAWFLHGSKCPSSQSFG